ncbi:hypothetical protein FHR21_001746 [Sphingopyxis panaciterrulae]|uniref:Uncharacterized protein n=1 Tax=Sphingopyxis panaciterrulae TaxID=462372 RepID=A0A7W9EQD9_9SPHN|nr:hypothetical protein [Sphingopyxis panaciterrulae]
MFAATFLVQALVAVLSAVVLVGVRLPMPTTAEISGGRPLSAIARQPLFIIAATCGAVSYTLACRGQPLSFSFFSTFAAAFSSFFRRLKTRCI